MKHHYLPRFYLAGFTRHYGADDDLWVFDTEEIKQWKSTPANSAHQRDFYKVDLGDGDDPNSFEKVLAWVESEVAPAVRQITDTQTLPKGEAFDLLINFVGLMAVRVPGARAAYTNPMKKLARTVLQMTLQSPEIWEAQKQRMRASGIEIRDNISYEDMRDFVVSDRYEIGISQNWEIHTMLERVKIILPLLAQRNWSLLVSDGDTPDLICSDRPVALEWTLPPPPPPLWHCPGFGMHNAILTFPLNRRIALVSRFEGREGVFKADAQKVAQINSLTGKYAERFLYTAEQDFFWLREDQSVCNRHDLCIAIRQSRQE